MSTDSAFRQMAAMTNLELVTEAIYDALANHHRINWSQAEVAARAALASIEAPATASVYSELVAALQAMVKLDECEAHMEEAYERILPQAKTALARASFRALIPAAVPEKENG